MNRLTSQPSSRNWTASQSSSSGWLGGSPCAPKSSAVLTMPGAEELEPEAVDRHAGRQRVVRGDQPLGQAQPVDRRARRKRRQERGHAPADLLASLVVFAALEQERRLGLAGLLAKDQGRRDLLVELLPRLARPARASIAAARRTRAGLGVGVLDEVGRGARLVWASVRLDRSSATIAFTFAGKPAPALARCGPNPGGERIEESARPAASRSRCRPCPSRRCRRAG